MKPTGVSIEKASWAVLRDEPLYSARFIDREGTQDLVLVMRVEELEWLLEAHPPLTFNLATWQSPSKTWVVAIAYQLYLAFGTAKGGIFYLNPRQIADAEILGKLLEQESLGVIFLSEDCSTHYTVKIPHAPQDLAHWQECLTKMNLTPTLDGEDDPDFEVALQEFQARFGVQDVLAGDIN